MLGILKSKKASNKVQKTLSEKITYAVVFVIYMFFALIYCYMLFWLIMTCFKTHREIILNPFSLPAKMQWKNFVEMVDAFTFNNTSMMGMVWNSIWHSVGCTLVGVWTIGSAAYVTTKYRFPGQKLYAPILMFSLIFPIYGSMGAGYRIVYGLGLDNNYLIILTAGVLSSWNFFYFQAFFSNLSWSYAEAAYIDGANDWQIYYQLMIPQSMGIFGTLGLLTLAGAWQDYSNSILYLTEMPTLPVGIYYFQNEMIYRARMDVLYCACLVSLVPIFALYIGFSKILFTNLSLGGIKM